MLSKKISVNMKSLMAKAQKRVREAEREELEARWKEDEEWRAFEVPKSRAAKKREEKAERRAEAAARKAEARWLAKKEVEELGMELERKKRGEKKVSEAESRCLWEGVGKASQGRTMTEVEYTRMVNVTNTNRLDGSVIEGNTTEGAIAGLSLNDHLAELMVKEKKMMAIRRGELKCLRRSNYFDDLNW